MEKTLTISDRFMSMFAEQGANNVVTGIDVEGFVQRLLLFDHCIIASIWLKDVQRLLRIVDPDAMCELLDSGGLSFYVDSATGAEIGQSRSQLNLTGNTSQLKENEFHFATIKGRDDPKRVTDAIDELSKTDGVSKTKAKRVAERVEGLILEPKGLVTLSEAYKAFYADLRTPDLTALKQLVTWKLHALGVKPKGLHLTIEEFVPEDFRVHSNLTTRFGLSIQTARKIVLNSLMELFSVYSRIEHMRTFTCIIGMEQKEEKAWNFKADSLYRDLTRESHSRERQFLRVASIAGLGERQLIKGGGLDLNKLINLRNSDELTVFRHWLRSAESKTDKEIHERVTSIRSKIGDLTNTALGKTLRLLLTNLPDVLPDPLISATVGVTLGAVDSFLLERLFPRDAVVSVLVKEYPAVFEKGS